MSAFQLLFLFLSPLRCISIWLPVIASPRTARAPYQTWREDDGRNADFHPYFFLHAFPLGERSPAEMWLGSPSAHVEVIDI